MGNAMDSSSSLNMILKELAWILFIMRYAGIVSKTRFHLKETTYIVWQFMLLRNIQSISVDYCLRVIPRLD